ncbi:MAG: hypothetical protein RL095_126 [Verrucomicrobiota bacterium]|jgi:chemotaxis protein CheC
MTRPLTALEVDILAESMNIGVGRAASTLSDLTSHKIEIHMHKVQVVYAAGLQELLSNCSPGWHSCILQRFRGPFSGEGICVFNVDPVDWIELIMAGQDLPKDVEARNDILLEMGNIMNSNLIGSVMNILGLCVEFDLPRYFRNNNCSVFDVELQTVDEGQAQLMLCTPIGLSANGRSLEMMLVLEGAGLQYFVDMFERQFPKPGGS